MNCQFSVKNEDNLPQPEIEHHDIKIEIKSEVDDEIGNPDIKCEAFPGVDPLSYVETELKVEKCEDNLEELVEKPQINGTTCGPNIVHIQEGISTVNVNNLSGMYILNQGFIGVAYNFSNVEDNLIPHTNKPFTCLICNKSFTKKSDLNRHMRIHNNDKPFNCPHCDMSFARKDKLERHYNVHNNDKQYECTFCNKFFADKYYLKTHLRIHKNEKPYNCYVCGKSFARKDNLNRHLNVHSCAKPFQCSICNKSLADKYYLKTHLLNHSNNEEH